MNKSQIRILKSHYLARWSVLRHNQKNQNKVLLLQDQFIIKNLLPGDTLCYNCLGEMYHDIIPNLSTHADKKYSNLVLINNLEFKFKTEHELGQYIQELAQALLLSNGRIIFSFEHRFLIYDRVSVSVESLLSNFLKQLKNFFPIVSLNLLGKAPAGYGDYFFCLDYRND